MHLARRPRHALTCRQTGARRLHDLSLGADLRVVSHSFDDAGNFTRLDGYALVTLRASLPVSEQIELFGRIENVARRAISDRSRLRHLGPLGLHRREGAVLRGAAIPPVSTMRNGRVAAAKRLTEG